MGVIQHGTMANAATVGQSLTAPEDGWQRYDGTDSKIYYTGNWARITESLDYNSTKSYTSTANDSIRIIFYGTKLRLISFTDSTSYSTASQIMIDGENSKVFSEAIGTQKKQILVYEKTGLGLGVHEAIITNTKHLGLDAIDIDGYLLSPAINIDKSTMDLTVGDTQQLTATTTPSAVGGT